jgi:hypothetical protein
LVDLDGDGRSDVISGCWPGEIYFFRRTADGKFAAGAVLGDVHGKPINVGSASSAFAFDWNGDGAVDLIVGNVLGEVYLIPNTGKALAFGTPRRLEAAGSPVKVNGDAAPVVADWDGDGKADLIVGAEDGSVVCYRNVGTANEPRLEAPRKLIGTSPAGWAHDDERRPGQWGLRVKPCVVDWDGDGRLDLLIGDRCGGFLARPSQTPAEAAEERKANDQLPPLRRKWADLFARYRTASAAAEQGGPRTGLDSLREQLRRVKDEIVVVQEIQERYRAGYQSHGFVWLFRRQPAAKIGARTP